MSGGGDVLQVDLVMLWLLATRRHCSLRVVAGYRTRLRLPRNW